MFYKPLKVCLHPPEIFELLFVETKAQPEYPKSFTDWEIVLAL